MLEELALILFPDKEFKNGSERFFYEGGRDILIAALTAFYFKGLDFPAICQKIKYTDYNALFSEIAETDNKKASGLLAQFRNQKETDIGGCMGQAANAISLFANEDYLNQSNFGRPLARERNLSADEVNNSFLVLLIPRKMRDVYAPLNKLITKQVMQVIDNRKIGQRPYCLLALDELSTLLKGSASVEDQLISSMQNIRKLNGRIIYLTQSIKDIDVYAGEGKRGIIVDNTGFIVAMGAFDPATRQFFADLIGKEVVTKDGTRHEEYRVDPDDFADLPDDKLYLIWRGGYLKLRKTFFFNDSLYTKSNDRPENGIITRCQA
jgi:type IV secretory pathway TraG/TraD family ATPase VirD4